MNRSFLKKAYLLATLLLSSVVLFGCRDTNIPRPTSQYYINDYAEVLRDATIVNIKNEGTRLFKDTNSYIHEGTELVVATFLVNNQLEVDNFDSKELFQSWSIGNQKMGLLVILFFEPKEDFIELIDTKIEVGSTLRQFLSAEQLMLVIDQTLYHANWDEDDPIDLPIMHMYYDLLETIYINVYDYISFTYDMNIYELYLASYRSDVVTSTKEMSYTQYMLFQIGINNDFLVIFFSIVMVLFISLSFVLIKKDFDLMIVMRKK